MTMDFNLSEEQAMLAEMAQRFCRDRDTLKFARNVEEIARSDWSQLAELGWLGISFSEELGGIGGDVVDMAVLTTFLGRSYVLSPLIVTSVLCGAIVARSHTAPQLVPEIIQGRIRIALAHGEGDVAAASVTARREQGGYRLTGAKFQVLCAGLAQFLLVSATIEGETAPSIFLLNPEAPGLSRIDYDMVDGTRAADLRLNDVWIEDGGVVLGSDLAQVALDEAIELASLAWLGEAVGAMEASIETCGAYLKERVQFGQPIGSFQALQQIIAAMFVEVQEARSALYYALANFGEGSSTRTEALSAAKLVIAASAKFVSRQGIQLHGGYGMTDEFSISHQFRRLMVIEKLFGDLDFHALRLADAVLGEAER